MKILNLLAFGILTYMMIALVACGEKPLTPAYSLGYAYGAQMAMSLEEMKLTAEEKNVDKFVEGFKAGLTVDSAAFAAAQQVLQERMGSAAPSTSPEAAQKIAYSMGLSSIGGLALEVSVAVADFDLEGLKEGFTKSVAKDSLMFNQVQMDSILKAYFNPKSEEYRTKMEAKKQAQAAKALEAGAKFLADNKARPGVVTTASGLQYEIIKDAKGPKPSLTDEVKTHYHGTLTDGAIFDSSVDRGEPATFPVNRVIQGWQEGIPLMSVGAKYRFFIPQDLAYGMQPPPQSIIPAGATLIFEVELLEINPKAETK